MTHHTWDVLPGGLAAADHDRIRTLAERGWKAHRIAREIRKNAGTVYWFMLRDGLVERKSGPQALAKPYQRGGRTVHPFSGEEDAFILALRVQGIGLNKIAERASQRFGTARDAHKVYVRLTILAASP